MDGYNKKYPRAELWVDLLDELNNAPVGIDLWQMHSQASLPGVFYCHALLLQVLKKT